ncbi:unnamed protein product [Pedinophyceae sp. YPF-701]|nr:unnamed protein product [Pedinophyceae sp. YPF-701]
MEGLMGPGSMLARPPISQFNVGAVALGYSGRLYLGVNLELPQSPLANSVHAEQFAIMHALLRGETGLHSIAVTAAPCGHCRQFLSELACAAQVRLIFVDHDGSRSPPGGYSLDDLLPHRFGPVDLLGTDFDSGEDAEPLLMEPRDNCLQLCTSSEAELSSHDATVREAAAAALSAANQSYAPYTKCPSGVAAITGDQVFSGPYVESAAFNPSLPPLQSCLVDAVSRGLASYEEITHVVLVETARGLVQQSPVIAAVVRAIAPQAQVLVLHAEPVDSM